ncbi:TIR domain-containing protein [Ktedonosporobacter rubrisoli]|uniref:TIR domain-containing protein n=1 Tax=Ktedonosporobacter rubrisoli TaxID=2509675 RepID=A0A4P6JN94_KTERU|nr:TIR domain-containing protein [Ktedonosporobacter rubrisoli]QBD76777.1 TIR domain-containing protein [Ktedonosporobacter rubrisoli]
MKITGSLPAFEQEHQGKKHFFISHAPADVRWAEWIGWHLEQYGYRVILPEWDFRPGSNSVLELHKAVIETERTLALLSPHYVNILCTLPDWTVTFQRDSSGEQHLLLPIRIQPCETEGIFLTLSPIELAGKNEQEALQILLKEVAQTRAKPDQPPRFPGLKPFVVGTDLERNPTFVGREHALKQIYTSLHKGYTVAITNSLSKSNGSVGKTEVAKEYAYRYQSNYRVLLWLQDNPLDVSHTPLLQSIESIVAVLAAAQPEMPKQATPLMTLRSWLTEQEDWLLILDGVKDVQIVEQLLPSLSKGHTLITTRNRVLASLAQLLEIDELASEDKALSQKLADLIDAALHSPNGEHIHLGLGEITIGSAPDNTIVRTDPSVSAYHAMITLKDGAYFLTDRKSTSGTFMNGQRLQPGVPYRLTKKDSIHIGKVVFAYASDAVELTPLATEAALADGAVASGLSLPRLPSAQKILRHIREKKAPDTWLIYQSERMSLSAFRSLITHIDIAGAQAFIVFLFLFISGNALIFVLAPGDGNASLLLFPLVLDSLAIGFFAVRMVKIIHQTPEIPPQRPYPDALLVLTSDGFIEYLDNDQPIYELSFADLVGMQMHTEEDLTTWLELFYRDQRRGQWSQRTHFGAPIPLTQEIIKAFTSYLQRHAP